MVEVSASLALAWRLTAERRGGCTQEWDRRAVKAIAIAFGVLALYVGVDAGLRLAAAERPEVSVVGIALAVLSLAVMPILARAKRDVAPLLGSRAELAEANQTSVCALMSAVVLIGLGLNALLGWWWADPVAALGIAVVAAVEGFRTWHSESLADTCCA